jgi:toxin ParE1/3/4
MARVIWTEPALNDLEVIADYIALDKPDSAKRYVQRVFEAVDRLERFPNSGSIPPEIPDLPYRQVVVPPCRVFYRAEKGHVFILYVMRSERLFREEILEERKKK